MIVKLVKEGPRIVALFIDGERFASIHNHGSFFIAGEPVKFHTTEVYDNTNEIDWIIILQKLRSERERGN